MGLASSEEGTMGSESVEEEEEEEEVEDEEEEEEDGRVKLEGMEATVEGAGGVW